MSRIQTFVQKQFTNLLLLFVTGGFLMLVAELLLTGHTRGIQLVAVVASVAGVVLALAGLLTRGKMSNIVAIAFLLLALTGLLGVSEHLEEGEGEREGVATAQVVRPNNATNRPVNLRQEPEFRAGARRNTPPPLAPLSLAGLSLLGTVTLVGRKETVG
ncbi:MAG: hypothetical protein U0350_14590 [Caldilineaceae bacterium]